MNAASPCPPGLLADVPISQMIAFALIKAERRYQDGKWGSLDEHPHEVGAWLLVMQGKVDAAVKKWQTTAGSDVPALWEVIKALAVGVACLEQHGGELLRQAIADMEFARTNLAYTTPGARERAYWPLLDKVRECVCEAGVAGEKS
jgi:hypothetical protein